MKFPNPFDREFWVMDEPPSNVIHLNTPKARAHARANAAQAAMTLEEDREAMRRERRLLIIQEIEQKRGEIFDLETEYEMLGGPVRG